MRESGVTIVAVLQPAPLHDGNPSQVSADVSSHLDSEQDHDATAQTPYSQNLEVALHASLLLRVMNNKRNRSLSKHVQCRYSFHDSILLNCLIPEFDANLFAILCNLNCNLRPP